MLSFNEDRLCICLSTGGGKTVIFSGFTKLFLSNNPGAKVLIAVNRIELLNQTVSTLSKVYGINPGIINRGSKSKPCTSVIVAMVETLFRRLNKWNFQDIDVLIIDECHKGDFFKILPLFKKIYGFSATPIYQKKGSCLADYYHNIIVPTTLKQLIENKYVSNARTYAPELKLDKSTVHIKGDDYDEVEVGKKLSEVNFIQQVVKYYERFKEHRAIIYNSSIEHSLEVTKYLKLAGANVRHLDGGTDKNERKHIFEWLKKTPGAWLCNVDVATTGVDVPEVTLIMINRLTRSLSLYIQMCGRGGRSIKIGESKYIDEKDEFIILDMHANCFQLGEWQDDRDWSVLFNERKKKKEGVAPVKSCPNCDAIISAGSATCMYCNFVFEKNQVTDKGEFEINLIEVSKVRTDAIKLIKLAEKREYKPISVVFKSMEIYGRELQSGMISPEQFREKSLIVANEYYRSQGFEKMNMGHVGFIEKLCDQKLKELASINENQKVNSY